MSGQQWIVLLAVLAVVWLFIRRRRKDRETPYSLIAVPDRRWRLSENGNPIAEAGGQLITVFARDGGWKFCLVDGEDDDTPYFSEPYRSQDEAKASALAMATGLPDPNSTSRQYRSETVGDSWNQHLESAEKVEAELVSELASLMSGADINVTKLRPIEKRLGTRMKQAVRARQYFEVQSDDRRAKRSDALVQSFQSMIDTVSAKIAVLKAPKKQ